MDTDFYQFRKSNRVLFFCPVCLRHPKHKQYYCSKCVISGSISKNDGGTTYTDMIKKIEAVKQKNQKLSSELNKHLQQSREFHKFNELKACKKELINDLSNAIVIKQNDLDKKLTQLRNIQNDTIHICNRVYEMKSKLKEINDAMKGTVAKCSQYENCTHAYEEKLISQRDQLCRELLNFFPIQLSADSGLNDSICEASLHTNRSNLSAGPEPNSSSQAAMQHLVLVVRTLSSILDVWLPIASRWALCLPRNFTGEFILRDDLYRVFDVICKCLSVLCASQGVTPAEYDPLASLQALKDSKSLGRCSPYILPFEFIFDCPVSNNMSSQDGWNTPLSVSNNQDWVEVSTDIPFDPAILSYEQSAQASGSTISTSVASSTVLASNYFSNIASSMWRWSTWNYSSNQPP